MTPFVITNIVWKKDAPKHLPTEHVVSLPNWLVLGCPTPRDHEWNGVVKEKLEAEFGHRPRRFGFHPA
jgi:hypothetical protein